MEPMGTEKNQRYKMPLVMSHEGTEVGDSQSIRRSVPRSQRAASR